MLQWHDRLGQRVRAFSEAQLQVEPWRDVQRIVSRFGVVQLRAATEVFHLLASQQVEQEQGLIALQNMVNDKLFSERTRKGIAEIWNAPTFDEDGDRNLYNLYNAGTQYLTHSIAENRRELAEKTSRRLLTTLNTAVRSEANLTTLITPRKTLQVAETVEDSLAI